MNTRIILCGACGKMGGNVLSLLQGDNEATAVCGVDLFPKEIGLPVYKSFADIKEQADVIIDFSSAENLKERLEYAKANKLGIVLASTGFSPTDLAMVDEYAKDVLGIPTKVLMDRSGEVIANTVKSRCDKSREVVILAGSGNNGGDGYAAACKLLSEYKVVVFDVFSKGQKSEEGKFFLREFVRLGGEIICYEPTGNILSRIKNAGCIIDAVFGTGFHGDMPEEIRSLAIAVRESVDSQKIAVDVPLGINADNGSVNDFAISVSSTVELSFIKPGIVSYPAKSYVGDIIYDDLGLPRTKLSKIFPFRYNLIDKKWVSLTLPRREENSNKGSFGKLLMITGSEKYRGAAHLSLEGALRGGVGLVRYAGCESLVNELSAKYPEAIYKKIGGAGIIGDEDISELVLLSKSSSATLLGSGSGNTADVLKLTLALLSSDGSPLILDADAINALSTIGHDGVLAIRGAKRQVIITPHPLEFARLSGNDVSLVQLHRLEAAEKFAKENKCTVVLKGAGTVITDGNEVYINSVGSSALAKAGSGDVLAGLISAFIAMDKIKPIKAASLAVYYHAVAGDSLADIYSSYGVTPSDLPKEIAKHLALTEKNRKEEENKFKN